MICKLVSSLVSSILTESPMLCYHSLVLRDGGSVPIFGPRPGQFSVKNRLWPIQQFSPLRITDVPRKYKMLSQELPELNWRLHQIVLPTPATGLEFRLNFLQKRLPTKARKPTYYAIFTIDWVEKKWIHTFFQRALVRSESSFSTLAGIWMQLTESIFCDESRRTTRTFNIVTPRFLIIYMYLLMFFLIEFNIGWPSMFLFVCLLI